VPTTASTPSGESVSGEPIKARLSLESAADGRLRVSSREAMEGRLFLTYLSLIIHSALSRIMKEQDLFKTYTLAEVFSDLKKLRLVTLTSGTTYLTEISKKQRQLFEKFDVPIPTA